MEPWRTESNPAKQMMLTAVLVLVGAVLMYGFRNFDSSGFTNSFAGFLLGVLLLVIGIPSLLMVGRQTIVVDPSVRLILIEKANRFGSKTTTISFNEIADLRVSSMGSRTKGMVTYYVTLELVSGKHVPLFFPDYYDGRWDRSVAESRCQRLAECLGRPAGIGTNVLS
ncbi:MAG TPA: hypothetical protein VMH23_02775 [Bacteroidota bacterium]|nr:hypothetical protein [Bacteroidota bacterium]